jgi:hypothetical protein
MNGSSQISKTAELAPDDRIAAGNRTLVADVALSFSEWDVSSGPNAYLSQRHDEEQNMSFRAQPRPSSQSKKLTLERLTVRRDRDIASFRKTGL